MNDVTKVIRAEWFKLRRQRSTIVVPVAVLAFAVLLYFVQELAARKNMFGVPSGFFVSTSVIGWMNTVLALIAVIVASFLVAQEFAIGTVKSTWVRPVRRGRWFFGKYLFAAGIVTDLFIIVSASAVGLALVRLGMDSLMEKDYVVHTLRSLSLRMLLTLGLTLFGLWAATALAAAVAASLNHPGGAIALTLGIGVAMMAASAFEPARPFLLTQYLSLPLEQMSAMAKGVPLPLEWGTLIWRTLAGAGAWLALALVVGLRVTQTKEITS